MISLDSHSYEPTPIDLTARMWPFINNRKTPIKLYGSKGKEVSYAPGERVIFPKQEEFLRAIRYYKATLYGGAMGSGKSTILRWALLDLLLEYASYGWEGVQVGLFCETYKAVRARHVNELKTDFKEFGVFKAQSWEFVLHPEYGSGVILLGNCAEIEEYKSVDFAHIGIDELTLNRKEIFDFLLRRLRSKYVQYCTIFAGSNPTGIGAPFVKEMFVDERTRVKPSIEIDPETGEEYEAKGYFFIKATPKDNPTLSRDYLHTISTGPKEMVDAYYHGDWDAMSGDFMKIIPGYHTVRDRPLIPSWRYYLAIDYAFGHTASAVVGAMDNKGTLSLVKCFSAKEMTPHEFKQGMLEEFTMTYVGPEGDLITEMIPFDLVVCDPAMDSRSMKGDLTPFEIFNTRQSDKMPALNAYKADNARVAGWNAIRQLLHFKLSATDAQGNECEPYMSLKPKLQIYESCWEVISSLNFLMRDPAKSDDCLKTKGDYGPGKGDDEADCVRYLVMAAIENRYKIAQHDEVDLVAAIDNPRTSRKRGEHSPSLLRTKWA